MQLLRQRVRVTNRFVRSASSTRGTVHYQSESVPSSLTTTGKVGTIRDAQGSDGEFFGISPAPTEVEISDARRRNFTLDDNGFCRVDHAWDHIDYFDNNSILNVYYPECEELVRRHTGASRVLAFDHNLRARIKKASADNLKGAGANAVQEPLVTYGVHNDYTLESAPRRIEQMSQPLGVNDTLRARAAMHGRDATPPLDPLDLERLLRGRWQFINVWRNVACAPVLDKPLALCDAASTVPEDLVVFEIRYADRVGENFFSRANPRHAWYYYPSLTRDEAIMIKCWDSRGAAFAGKMEAARGYAPCPTALSTVPATFSLHTGFEDPATPPGAPERESIEVRLVAFYE